MKKGRREASQSVGVGHEPRNCSDRPSGEASTDQPAVQDRQERGSGRSSRQPGRCEGQGGRWRPTWLYPAGKTSSSAPNGAPTALAAGTEPPRSVPATLPGGVQRVRIGPGARHAISAQQADRTCGSPELHGRSMTYGNTAEAVFPPRRRRRRPTAMMQFRASSASPPGSRRRPCARDCAFSSSAGHFRCGARPCTERCAAPVPLPWPIAPVRPSEEPRTRVRSTASSRAFQCVPLSPPNVST